MCAKIDRGHLEEEKLGPRLWRIDAVGRPWRHVIQRACARQIYQGWVDENSRVGKANPVVSRTVYQGVTKRVNESFVPFDVLDRLDDSRDE